MIDEIREIREEWRGPRSMREKQIQRGVREMKCNEIYLVLLLLHSLLFRSKFYCVTCYFQQNVQNYLKFKWNRKTNLRILPLAKLRQVLVNL